MTFSSGDIKDQFLTRAKVYVGGAQNAKDATDGLVESNFDGALGDVSSSFLIIILFFDPYSMKDICVFFFLCSTYIVKKCTIII